MFSPRCYLCNDLSYVVISPAQLQGCAHFAVSGRKTIKILNKAHQHASNNCHGNVVLELDHACVNVNHGPKVAVTFDPWLNG